MVTVFSVVTPLRRSVAVMVTVPGFLTVTEHPLSSPETISRTLLSPEVYAMSTNASAGVRKRDR